MTKDFLLQNDIARTLYHEHASAQPIIDYHCHLNPQEIAANKQYKDITEIWIKDYYTLQWLDARKAFYVVGSDVYGPMGKEVIPFSSRDAAENFLQDHHGEKIFVFDDISDDLVQSMRSGSTMRHGVK